MATSVVQREKLFDVLTFVVSIIAIVVVIIDKDRASMFKPWESSLYVTIIVLGLLFILLTFFGVALIGTTSYAGADNVLRTLLLRIVKDGTFFVSMMIVFWTISTLNYHNRYRFRRVDRDIVPYGRRTNLRGRAEPFTRLQLALQECLLLDLTPVVRSRVSGATAFDVQRYDSVHVYPSEVPMVSTAPIRSLRSSVNVGIAIANLLASMRIVPTISDFSQMQNVVRLHDTSVLHNVDETADAAIDEHLDGSTDLKLLHAIPLQNLELGKHITCLCVDLGGSDFCPTKNPQHRNADNVKDAENVLPARVVYMRQYMVDTVQVTAIEQGKVYRVIAPNDSNVDLSEYGSKNITTTTPTATNSWSHFSWGKQILNADLFRATKSGDVEPQTVRKVLFRRTTTGSMSLDKENLRLSTGDLRHAGVHHLVTLVLQHDNAIGPDDWKHCWCYPFHGLRWKKTTPPASHSDPFVQLTVGELAAMVLKDSENALFPGFSATATTPRNQYPTMFRHGRYTSNHRGENVERQCQPNREIDLSLLNSMTPSVIALGFVHVSVLARRVERSVFRVGQCERDCPTFGSECSNLSLDTFDATTPMPSVVNSYISFPQPIVVDLTGYEWRNVESRPSHLRAFLPESRDQVRILNDIMFLLQNDDDNVTASELQSVNPRSRQHRLWTLTRALRNALPSNPLTDENYVVVFRKDASVSEPEYFYPVDPLSAAVGEQDDLHHTAHEGSVIYVQMPTRSSMPANPSAPFLFVRRDTDWNPSSSVVATYPLKMKLQRRSARGGCFVWVTDFGESSTDLFVQTTRYSTAALIISALTELDVDINETVDLTRFDNMGMLRMTELLVNSHIVDMRGRTFIPVEPATRWRLRAMVASVVVVALTALRASIASSRYNTDRLVRNVHPYVAHASVQR